MSTQTSSSAISPNAYITDTKTSGRAAFASETIKAGLKILQVDSPLVCIPDDAHLNECCSHCLSWRSSDETSKSSVSQAYSRNARLSYCLGCKVTKYCSKKCQSSDWKQGHSYDCKIYKSLYPRVLPTTARAIIRMARLFLDETAAANASGGIGGLKAHAPEFSKSSDEERWSMMNLTAKAAAEYSKLAGKVAFEPEFMRDLFCKLLVNSFTVTTQSFDPIGICLDYKAAMINHSCDPNAVMLFDGRTLLVRSIKEIPKDAEITISYIERTDSRERRQTELNHRYFFTCACTACRRNDILWDNYACYKCGNFILYGEEECPSCNTERLATIPVIEEKAMAAYSTASKPLTISSSSEISSSVTKMEKSLKSLYTSRAFSQVHQPIPNLHQSLAQAFISASQWSKALEHLLIIYVTIDPIIYDNVPFHPVRVVKNFTLAMVLLQVSVLTPEKFDFDYTKIMYGLMTEVCGNVDKSHGQDSSFAVMVRNKMRDIEADITIDTNYESKDWFGKGLMGIPELREEVTKIERIVRKLVEELKVNDHLR